jgi:hypothetical protein
MNIVFLIIVFVFVTSVLAFAGYALLKISPFATHSDRYRDPDTGRRLYDSPHLD